ncbi:hypothetical protein DCAR_0207175 [Daucus carota subsp. sativus]|uniref:Ribonuclease n=1 Tax=Daucus carota subsp. sativus TaxID=79200 RepID=A0AAF0WEA2_DAUCS|nr:hypothetical protein DCAR_0207175 [Daucus carota subsp. sativus]
MSFPQNLGICTEIIWLLYRINLNEIYHNSAIGLVRRALNTGVLLTEVYVDTVGDPEKYRTKLSDIFPSIKFVVAKKADSHERSSITELGV